MNPIHFKYKNWEFEGISEGGIRTSIAVPSLSLMFDYGNVVPENIKYNTLLLTHSHLDHSAGLPYYISQRSLQKLPPPKIFVPAEVEEDFRELFKIYAKLEGFDYHYELIGAKPNERYMLNKNFYFEPIRTHHRVISQGYTILEKRSKLKPEFAHLNEKDFFEMGRKGIELNQISFEPVISFSGDTKIEYVILNPLVQKSKILFLECTYIDEKKSIENAREWGHIHLNEIAQHASSFQNEQLVLIHFSKRYRKQEIINTVKAKLPKELMERTRLFL